MNAYSSSLFSQDPWPPNHLHHPTSPLHPIPPHQAGSLTAALKTHCQDLRVKRLFDHPDLQRTPIHYKKLARRHPLTRPLAFLDLSFPVLARRSLFMLQQTPLLVTEVFLDYPTQSSRRNTD